MAKDPKIKISAEDKTKAAFGTVGKGLSKLGSAAKGLSIGVAAGGAAFAAFGKQALDTADAIGKTADRAGISTKALQEMRHGFDLAGVSAEAVDKSFVSFGKRLGKARDGIGALAGGLKKGQAALLDNLLATKSNEEALKLVFKAMGNAKDQAEKLAIADAAFGGAGLKMTAAFNQGSEAFFAANKEASDLGIVLDEKGVRSAEQFNDAMTRVSGSLTGGLQNAFLTIVPTLLEHEDQIKNIAQAVGVGIVDAAKVAGPILLGLGEGFKLVGGLIADAAIWIDKLLTRLGKLGEFGSQAVEKFQKGFTEKWESVKGTVTSLIPEGLRDFLEQNSPAKEGVLDSGLWGSNVVKLFAAGMEGDMDKLKTASDGVAGTLADTIGGAILSLKDGFGGLRDFALSTLSSIGGKLASEGLTSLIQTGIESIQGRASGGPVTGGQPYIVGEKRPELFVPNSNGRIVPDVGGGGGKSDTVNIVNNFTINALDSRSVAELISQGEPNRVIVGSIQKAFNRMGKKAALA